MLESAALHPERFGDEPLTQLTPPRFEGSLDIAPGRSLGYAEYGPSSGRPILWFHGTPGGRRQISPRARRAAQERGIRLIAVERPGVGASTPHSYRRILEWGEDMRRLCDALELGPVAVAGLSGGGPYALACARSMPERVVQVAILGGVAPATGADAAAGGVSELVRRFSPLLHRARNPLGRVMRGLVLGLQPLSAQVMDAFAAFMPPGDQRLFEDELMRTMFIEDLTLGARTHMQALILDVALFGREWGFALEEIEVPVHMWYGDADNIVPLAHGEFMAKRIPRATLRVRPDEGHLGGLAAADEVFEAILAEWPEKPGDHDRTSAPSGPGETVGLAP
jgi:pimeloyl-ACP methyl ester carboxylesterase